MIREIKESSAVQTHITILQGIILRMASNRKYVKYELREPQINGYHFVYDYLYLFGGVFAFSRE